MKSELNNIKQLIKKSKDLCDDISVTYKKNNILYSNIKNNKIENCVSEIKSSFIVKVAIGQKEGTSFSQDINYNTIKKAISIARINKNKNDYFGLPKNAKYDKIKGIYDEKLEKFNESDIIDESNKIINIFKKYNSRLNNDIKNNNIKQKKIKISESVIEKSCSDIIIANSNEINNEYKTTDYAIYIQSSLNNKNLYDKSEYKKEFFDSEDLCNQVIDKNILFSNYKSFNVINKSNKNKFSKKNQQIIFSNNCFSELLENTILENINAKNIINGNSNLKNKLNEKIFDNISITDDATLNKGILSRPFDFEGNKSKKTIIFDKGFLKNYLSDYNSAKKLGINSSSNASELGIEHSNILISGPHKPISEGIFVDSIIGAHTSNSLTGDFSVNVDRAYIWENDKKIPVQNFMISGNIITLLNNIISINKKVEQSNGIYSGSIVTNNLNIN
jgi:PmbA protein